jgi:hypothetical protein
MADPLSSGGLLKHLTKDALVYVIGIIIITGGYIVQNSEVGATWYVGLSLLGFGIVSFLVKLIASFFDDSHKRNYADLIKTQASTIKRLEAVNKEFSKNTIAVHKSVTSQTTSSSQLPGGFERVDPNATTTK